MTFIYIFSYKPVLIRLIYLRILSRENHIWLSWLSSYVCFYVGSCIRHNLKKLTYEERKARLIERLNALNSAAGGGGDDDEDDDDE